MALSDKDLAAQFAGAGDGLEVGKQPKGHVHAALMAIYAQDAAECDLPWERWQYMYLAKKEWRDCRSHPLWTPDVAYRRKPRTIRIGEFDVPEPLRAEPPHNARVFSPCLQNGGFATSGMWHKDLAWCKRDMARGLLHLTREAAEIHAKALLSLTEVRS